MSECLPDFTPDFPGAAVAPSPNHGERLDVVGPDIILLHYTGMTTADGALSWLCNPESQVSSHYFVFEDGRVIQMVPETRRAWHAGKSTWAGDQDINSRSIGIEIANQGHPGGLPEFPKKQVDAVIELCRDCGQRWNIAPERVLAHSDVAPIRKVDPGRKIPVGHPVAERCRSLGGACADPRRALFPARRPWAAGGSTSVDAVHLWIWR